MIHPIASSGNAHVEILYPNHSLAMITERNVPPTFAPTITPIPEARDSNHAHAKAITIVDTIVPDCNIPASMVPANIDFSLVLTFLESHLRNC